MNRQLLIQLIAIFAVTQVLGLYVAANLMNQNIEPAFPGDKNDVANAFVLFAYILVFTVMLLAFMKFFKGRRFFKVIEALVIFSTTLIVVDAFLPEAAFLFAVIMVALRNIISDNIMLRNISSIIAVAGAGALIGISLGWMVVLVFMVLLSLYDIVAVFGTKHMVTMGKEITKKNLAFTVAMPTKEHTFEMGTGDLVIPLTFAVSVMGFSAEKIAGPLYLVPAFLILLASLLGLIWTLNYSSKHVGMALPALPPQTLCMLIVFGIMLAAGVF